MTVEPIPALEPIPLVDLDLFRFNSVWLKTIPIVVYNLINHPVCSFFPIKSEIMY